MPASMRCIYTCVLRHYIQLNVYMHWELPWIAFAAQHSARTHTVILEAKVTVPRSHAEARTHTHIHWQTQTLTNTGGMGEGAHALPSRAQLRIYYIYGHRHIFCPIPICICHRLHFITSANKYPTPTHTHKHIHTYTHTIFDLCFRSQLTTAHILQSHRKRSYKQPALITNLMWCAPSPKR